MRSRDRVQNKLKFYLNQAVLYKMRLLLRELILKQMKKVSKNSWRKYMEK